MCNTLCLNFNNQLVFLDVILFFDQAAQFEPVFYSMNRLVGIRAKFKKRGLVEVFWPLIFWTSILDSSGGRTDCFC